MNELNEIRMNLEHIKKSPEYKGLILARTYVQDVTFLLEEIKSLRDRLEKR